MVGGFGRWERRAYFCSRNPMLGEGRDEELRRSSADVLLDRDEALEPNRRGASCIDVVRM